MKVQSLSVHVPTGKCPNSCRYCVSQMHPSPYENLIGTDYAHKSMHEHQYMRRLAFARDNGCNTLIFTGDGEALTNWHFIDLVAKMNWAMKSSPFRWMELQTSGILLNRDMLMFLRDTVGVSTISLSLASFVSATNQVINGIEDKLSFCIEDLCDMIKGHGLNLRLSLNMNSEGFTTDPESIFDSLDSLGADQVTFRKLYKAGIKCAQDEWIEENDYDTTFISIYIRENGRALERLPFGAMRYSVNGISSVVDDDCMSTDVKDTAKYLILRPNCKLYTKWDDEGSLLF